MITRIMIEKAEIDTMTPLRPCKTNNKESYVTNCLIVLRDDDYDATLFDTIDNQVVVRLDSYAILPLDFYRELCHKAGMEPQK